LNDIVDDLSNAAASATMRLTTPLKAFRVLVRSDIRPFYDDKRLQQLVLELLGRYGIWASFETGTFRGDTVKWVAERAPGVACWTVEKNYLYYLYAKMRTMRANIVLLHDDSRRALKKYLRQLPTPVMFWLDAHWEKELPLKYELGIMRDSGTLSVVLIDDFRHPRMDLGYDCYNQVEIGAGLVKSVLPDVQIFVPSYKAPRGYAVFFLSLPVWVPESLEST